MIGKNAVELIAIARKLDRPTRMCISLTQDKLVFGTTSSDRADLIMTNGHYHISYQNYTRTGEPNKKRFCILLDFGPKFIKCTCYDELVRQAQTNDYARFIIEFTNLEPHYFDIAAQNEGMKFPVEFDVMKYDRIMREKWGVGEKEYAMIYNPFKDSIEKKWSAGFKAGEIEEIPQEFIKKAEAM